MLPLSVDAEITLEANPGTFEAEKFRGFRDAGVNRLSIGIQSFNPAHLKALGPHPRRCARRARAIDIARATFDNFNLDLMYALPAQTLAEALADIETALAFRAAASVAVSPDARTEHVFPPVSAGLPDDDATAQMQDAIETRLAAAGYRHYETSAFAQPGPAGAAQHELLDVRATIWASARARTARFHSPTASRGRCGSSSRGNTWRAPKAATRYRSNTTSAAQEIGFEFMMNALRLTGGFPLVLFEERAGVPLTVRA